MRSHDISGGVLVNNTNIFVRKKFKEKQTNKHAFQRPKNINLLNILLIIFEF